MRLLLVIDNVVVFYVNVQKRLDINSQTAYEGHEGKVQAVCCRNIYTDSLHYVLIGDNETITLCLPCLDDWSRV